MEHASAVRYPLRGSFFWISSGFLDIFRKKPSTVRASKRKLELQTRAMRSLKTSGMVGGIVGLQLLTQSTVENCISQSSAQNASRSMLLSVALVSAVSAAPLAILNAQLRGFSFLESIKRLSAPQLGSICMRELDFWAF